MMALAILTVCDWDSDGERDTLVANPTWAQIEAAIRRLNNQNLNDVYLQPDRDNTETYLGIGGGNGRYIVTGANSNKTFPTIVHGDRPGERKVTLVVGGQLGEYPENWIVDLESALRAARAFYDAGGFSTNEKWVNV